MISSISPATTASTSIPTERTAAIIPQKTTKITSKNTEKPTLDITGFSPAKAGELPNKFEVDPSSTIPILIAGKTVSVEKEREMIKDVFKMVGGNNEISLKEINEFEGKIRNGESDLKNTYNEVKMQRFTKEEVLKVLNLFKTLIRQYGDKNAKGEPQQVLTMRQLETIFSAHPKTNYIYGKNKCTSPTDRAGEESILTKLFTLIDSKYGTKPFKNIPFIGGDYAEQGLNDNKITVANIDAVKEIVNQQGGRSLGIKTVGGELLSTPTINNMLTTLQNNALKRDGTLTMGQLGDYYDTQKAQKKTVFSPLNCNEILNIPATKTKADPISPFEREHGDYRRAEG